MTNQEQDVHETDSIVDEHVHLLNDPEAFTNDGDCTCKACIRERLRTLIYLLGDNVGGPISAKRARAEVCKLWSALQRAGVVEPEHPDEPDFHVISAFAFSRVYTADEDGRHSAQWAKLEHDPETGDLRANGIFSDDEADALASELNSAFGNLQEARAVPVSGNDRPWHTFLPWDFRRFAYVADGERRLGEAELVITDEEPMWASTFYGELADDIAI